MKNSLANYLVLSLAVAVLASCSSSSKKDETPAPAPETKAQAGATEAATDDLGDTKDQKEASQGQDASAAGAPTHSGTEPKYKALVQAVRSGTGNGILDETAKILSGDANDVVALNAAALYHFKRNHPEAAKLLLNRALEKNPGIASLYNNLAVVFEEEGEQGTAIANYKKALHIDPNNSYALGNLGSIYARGGDFTRAQPLLEQSYKQNRANATIAINYAATLRAAGALDKAKDIYEDVIKKDSRNVAAHLNYAILLIDFMNKPKDGLAMVYKLKFIETDDKDVLARANALEKKAKSELK